MSKEAEKNIPTLSNPVKRSFAQEFVNEKESLPVFFFIKSSAERKSLGLLGGYKTKTEDLRHKNEDSVKIVLKSLKKGSNMILDRSRNKEHQDLQLSTNLTRVFVLYITLPKVQNEEPVKIVLKLTRFSVDRSQKNLWVFMG